MVRGTPRDISREAAVWARTSITSSASHSLVIVFKADSLRPYSRAVCRAGEVTRVTTLRLIS
jgi:hypothetical protein